MTFVDLGSEVTAMASCVAACGPDVPAARWLVPGRTEPRVTGLCGGTRTDSWPGAQQKRDESSYADHRTDARAEWGRPRPRVAASGAGLRPPGMAGAPAGPGAQDPGRELPQLQG